MSEGGNSTRGYSVDYDPTNVQHLTTDDPAAVSISADPVPAFQPDVSSHPAEAGAPSADSAPVQAIDAFEGVYQSNPAEFQIMSSAGELTPDARRRLASLLTLSAAARDALVEVLRLPDDVRAVVNRVLQLPPEVRETLRVFLSS